MKHAGLDNKQIVQNMANEEDFILRGEELINQPNISVGEFLLEICQYHDDKVALVSIQKNFKNCQFLKNLIKPVKLFF